jgi:hypothetical protein
MNDVLVPLCEGLGVNLVVGKGYSSITRAVELLERIQNGSRTGWICGKTAENAVEAGAHRTP